MSAPPTLVSVFPPQFAGCLFHLMCSRSPVFLIWFAFRVSLSVLFCSPSRFCSLVLIGSVSVLYSFVFPTGFRFLVLYTFCSVFLSPIEVSLGSTRFGVRFPQGSGSGSGFGLGPTSWFGWFLRSVGPVVHKVGQSHRSVPTRSGPPGWSTGRWELNTNSLSLGKISNSSIRERAPKYQLHLSIRVHLHTYHTYTYQSIPCLSTVFFFSTFNITLYSPT